MDPTFLFMRFHSMANSFFIWKMIYFLENDLESSLIFVLFFRENKIRKKTLSVIPYLEKVVYEKSNMGLRARLLIGKVR